MYQTIIKGALVYDGTGNKPAVLDVAVENGLIASVSPQLSVPAKNIISANGLILAPGFIDTQNHSDTYWQVFSNPSLDSILLQGFTTLILGNSGASLAPLISKESLKVFQKWQNTTGFNVNWRSYQEFVQTMSGLKFGSNLISLVGYTTLRRGLIGDDPRPLSAAEIEVLLRMVSDCFNHGAVGLSVGLQYAHELGISDAELVELAELCSKHDKPIVISLRNEDKDIINSVREVCALAEQVGVAVKISHIKIRHQENWPLLSEVLGIIESAVHRGASVHFDTYPYTETWQPLYTLLPTWAQEGGRDALLARLKDESTRKRILSALTNHSSALAQIVIASTSSGLKVSGKTIGAMAKNLELSSEEAILNLIEHGGHSVMIFDNCLDQTSVNIFCNHALGFIGSNGAGFSTKPDFKLVHPRCFGSSPKFLRQVINTKSISLEEAISKLTLRPAKFFGLAGKGKIAVDFDADLVLFNPDLIDSSASLSNPFQAPTGIESVWIRGEQVVIKNRVIEPLSGVWLKS